MLQLEGTKDQKVLEKDSLAFNYDILRRITQK